MERPLNDCRQGMITIEEYLWKRKQIKENGMMKKEKENACIKYRQGGEIEFVKLTYI